MSSTSSRGCVLLVNAPMPYPGFDSGDRMHSIVAFDKYYRHIMWCARGAYSRPELSIINIQICRAEAGGWRLVAS